VDAFRVIRRLVPRGVPLGACGGWRSAAVMSRLIDEEGFDFFSASRPFIAEPDIYARMLAGQDRAACNSCNECVEEEREGIVRCPPILENRLTSPYLKRRVEPAG
jgi:2,4-dienoyl-CoA reductase-like NADH-dependent reductase (Old Yellow Enzyme family)